MVFKKKFPRIVVPLWFAEVFGAATVSALLLVIVIALGMRFIPNISAEEYFEFKAAVKLLTENILVPKRPEQFTYALSCLLAPVLIYLVLRFGAVARYGAWLSRRLLIPVLLFYFCCWLYTDILVVVLNPCVRMPLATLAALLPAVALWKGWGMKAGTGSAVAWVLLGVLIVVQMLALQLLSPGSDPDLLEGDHLNVILGNLVQTAAGDLPLHQYGFYAQFFAPLLRMTGVTLLSSSLILALLHAIGVVAVGVAGFRMLRGNVWLQCSFAALIFFSWGMFNCLHFSSEDPYFANAPVRFLMPALGLLIFVKLRSKRWFASVAGVLSGIAVFWNLDSGIPVAAAFFAVLLLRAIFAFSRKNLLALLFYAGGALVGMAFSLGMIYMNSGRLPEFERIMHFQQFFSAGFMMLWMPPVPAPWAAVLLVYLVALTAGIRAAVRGRVGRFAESAVFLSVLGLGVFLYYEGRSHDLNLPPVWWPSFLLLFWFTRLLLKSRRFIIVRLAALPGVVVASLLLTVLAIDVPMMALSVYENCRILPVRIEDSAFADRIAFIREHLDPSGKAVIYTRFTQGVLYAESGARPWFSDFNTVENAIMLVDYERCLNLAENSGTPVFCDWPVPARFPHHRPVAVSRDGRLLYLLPVEKFR